MNSVNWTDDDGGAVLGSDPELELVLNTDRKITANFNKLNFCIKLTVSVNGSQGGVKSLFLLKQRIIFIRKELS